MLVLEGKWLAAVSAGPDSMALLGMCLEQNMNIAVAHVNYHHRDQAEEEEAYIRSFCTEHDLECYVLNDPFVYEGNFEGQARTWRYDFFVKMAHEHQCKGILIAHHEDDLLETYLMQDEKNTIPEYYGLKEGSVYQGVRVMRPLLSYTKKQLQEYCDQKHIRYYIDVTNDDVSLTRNRIRHEMVEPMTPFERDMVLREIRQRNAVMQERRCRVKTMIRTDRVNMMQYRALSRDDREALLRMVIEPDKTEQEALSLKFIREIDHVVMSQDDFVLPIRTQYLVQQDGWFFMHEGFAMYEDVYQTREELLKAGEHARYRIADGEAGVNALTLQEEDFPLTIRCAQEGDRIEMRFGHKPVYRFFIDRHIPLYRRKTWPVVCSASGEVIMVPGLGCDVRHFSPSPDVNVLEYTLYER